MGVKSSAGRAAAARPRLFHPEKALGRAQLRVDLLQLRRLAQQHVEPEVVPHGHLVCQPSQIPLELREASGQVVSPLGELGPPWPGVLRKGVAVAPVERAFDSPEALLRVHLITCPPPPPPGALLSFGGALPGSTVVVGSFFDRFE